MSNLVTVENCSKKLNEHSIVMMWCMDTCGQNGRGGPSM
jgi:hypothetical protein